MRIEDAVHIYHTQQWISIMLSHHIIGCVCKLFAIYRGQYMVLLQLGVKTPSTLVLVQMS